MNPHVRPPQRPPSTPAARALAAWLDPLTARVRREEVESLAAEPRFDPDDIALAARSLVASARRDLARRERMMDRADALRTAAAGEPPAVVRRVLERHLRVTVEDPLRRWGDLRALDRDLDLDGLLEREAEVIEGLGARVEVAVRALGGVARALVDAELPRLVTVIDDSGAQELLIDLSLAEARAPTRRAAVEALADCVGALLRAQVSLRAPGLPVLEALIEDGEESPWVRRRALTFARALPEGRARLLLDKVLRAREGREPFLLRAAAAEQLVTQRDPLARALLARTLDDPSELVRFTLIEGLARRLARGDDEDVPLYERALTATSARDRGWAADRLRLAGPAAWPLLRIALNDADPTVVSYGLEAGLALCEGGEPPPQALEEDLERLAAAADPALAREALELLAAWRARSSCARALVPALAALREGEARQVQLPPDARPLDLALALVPAAREGFGFSLEPELDEEQPGQRVRVQRGDRQATRLRRVLHELRTPRPDKRQGHAHGAARVDDGALRVPPSLLAEENPTGVPGQRVVVPRQGGWVPALPGVDDLAHALWRPRLRFVTAEGVTTLARPSGLLPWLRAWWAIQWRYASLSRLRLASLEAEDEGGRLAFARAVGALGFTLGGPDPAPGRPPAPRPARAVLGAAVDPLAYVLTLGANSARQLALIIALLALMLFGRAALARQAVRAARARVPLVIGGWGTRGKSGTERLKAGLMEGLGLPFLSKTTGCEAMVLHAPPGGRAVELFLFRPYDKATIWEQLAVARLAARLDSRALLWECMGLNPVYVDLLQRGWMRDDLSTLTNAYPDHEDVMGPSGLDVARVIGGFAPPEALVLTTERAMLPVLAEEARARGATLEALPRAARALVPADLLARTPHAEHPANLALAAAAAEALGVHRVEAMGLMAEHVLPDLGALMVYPERLHMGRRLEFTNAMSANDEVSCLHSWRRAGFDQPLTDAATWHVTVINNRADRIPRSRVFARILVRHAHAHAHVLIGTNLQGLRRYIDEALEELLAEQPLDDLAQRQRAFARLPAPDPVALARALRPAETAALEAWARAVAEAPPCEGDLSAARAAARGHLPPPFAEDAPLAEALADALARELQRRALDGLDAARARALYAERVRASLVSVHDPKTSGDRIIARIAALAPPGARVRVIGMQNIKGTGLDFAYQWVWWREVHRQLQRLPAGGAEAAAALQALQALPVGSVMVGEALIEALEPLRDAEAAGPMARSLLERAIRRRDALLRARAQGAAPREASALLRLSERLLDPFDAILRARRARQVLTDLGDRRISHRRAREVLAELTARQKGGWLRPTRTSDAEADMM